MRREKCLIFFQVKKNRDMCIGEDKYALFEVDRIESYAARSVW